MDFFLFRKIHFDFERIGVNEFLTVSRNEDKIPSFLVHRAKKKREIPYYILPLDFRVPDFDTKEKLGHMLLTAQ